MDELVQIDRSTGAEIPKSARTRSRHRLPFEKRIWLLALLAGIPGTLVALALLWSGDYSTKVRLTFAFFVVVGWLGIVGSLQHQVVYPLRTISNMLAALREGDFSMRARGAGYDDALSEVLLEVNALSEILRTQRLGAMEATALLRKVISEIDVVVFAFDADHRLQLVNQRGQQLLNRPAGRLCGDHAEELNLEEFLSGDSVRTIDLTFPGSSGRWEIRRSQFRESGVSHYLLVLSDLTHTLREEERQAWRRLIQVLRHEINNSLAPIDSLAGSLETLLTRENRADDWETDLREGLTVIQDRSKALNRFMTAYSQLTRLPKPKFEQVDITKLAHRVAGLETRLAVSVKPGPEITIRADVDQLEQLLINLIRNAVDASLDHAGEVVLGWNTLKGVSPQIEIWVQDEGPGLSSTENLFVPFFTTKPDGSGIGLTLCRQIAEGHNGHLTLNNRLDRTGCCARLYLPLT